VLNKILYFFAAQSNDSKFNSTRVYYFVIPLILEFGR
jgi:hypothetical protein